MYEGAFHTSVVQETGAHVEMPRHQNALYKKYIQSDPKDKC